MMKNSLSLWIIAVSLTIILIFIPVQEAYAAATVAFQTDDSKTITSDGIRACFDVNDVNNIDALTTNTNWSIDGNALTGGTVTFVDNDCGANNNDGVTIAGMTAGGGLPITINATPTIELANIGLEHSLGDTQTGAISIVLADGIISAGGDDIPPSYTITFTENEYPISIGDTQFKREQLGFNNPTTTVEIGKPIRVNLLIYDDSGPTYITQVGLFTNINGIFRDISHSDTSIIFKKAGPRIVLDPNGFFSNVTLTSSIINQKLQVTFDITFAKEMEKSDIIVQARDVDNNVGTLTVSDAWQVIQPQTVEETETTDESTDESTDVSVPDEIKVKTLNVEKSSYVMGDEILFSGTVDGYKFKSIVGIAIRNPSGGLLTMISTFPDKDGNFEAKIETDRTFKTDGTYSATAFTDDPNSGTRVIFYFLRNAPPPPAITTSPAQSIQAEKPTEPEPTTSEPITPKPIPTPSFVDPAKDPQSYVDRYNNEPSYREWFDENYPDYTIYEAVGLEPVKEKVPGWIKNNAKWWSEGQIGDSDFTSGIQHLIKEKIIDIPDLPETSEKARPSFVDPAKDPQSYVDRYNNEPSYREWFDENHPDYTIEEAVGIPESIPDWIKNNAKWWADGLISEDDFVNGIKYLVEKAIIKV